MNISIERNLQLKLEHNRLSERCKIIGIFNFFFFFLMKENKQSTLGYLDYHTMDNHTIYKEKAQNNREEEKKRWENPKTTNCSKLTQAQY